MRLAIVNIYASFNCQHLQRKLIHRKYLKKASPTQNLDKFHLKSFVQYQPTFSSSLCVAQKCKKFHASVLKTWNWLKINNFVGLTFVLLKYKSRLCAVICDWLIDWSTLYDSVNCNHTFSVIKGCDEAAKRTSYFTRISPLLQRKNW